MIIKHRLGAFVRASSSERNNRQFIGFPPLVSGEKDGRACLPGAVALIIDCHVDGVSLLRYGKHREFAGDTWHLTLDEAKEQAGFEYQISPSDWVPIPDNVEDAFAFITSCER